jgi:UDP-N-acetylglucosamine 2-epimerase (non-hydrolysing)
MHRISVILGTRPEAIKLAPVVAALRKLRTVKCRVCVTAQHRELLDQTLGPLGINADVDLDLMRPGQTLASLTARAIESLDHYLDSERPELVLVQGDTTTVLCAALAAFYRRIPLGHVEAGLRTGNLASPWPEEANRVVCSRLAALHFAPTQSARANLLTEGVADNTIFVTGNTGVDALQLALAAIRERPQKIVGLETWMAPGNTSPLVLITGHRRENFGAGLESMCQAIAKLSRKFPQTQFVFPVHLNPQVRGPVERILGTMAPNAMGSANIHLLEPLAYLEFVAVLSRAMLVLTDSGGVQEEAPSLGKPVLVMRDTTERPEGVTAGSVMLVGTNTETIVGEVSRLLTDTRAYESMARVHHCYGDGHAATRIAELCESFLRGELRQ